jgi:hypothetical protein
LIFFPTMVAYSSQIMVLKTIDLPSEVGTHVLSLKREEMLALFPLLQKIHPLRRILLAKEREVLLLDGPSIVLVVFGAVQNAHIQVVQYLGKIVRRFMVFGLEN